MPFPPSAPLRLCVSLFLGIAPAIAAADGTLTFEVSDAGGQPIPARVHLRNDAGQAVRSLGLTDRLDHLAVDGQQTVDVPSGTYAYSIERSPQWERVGGEIIVADGESRTVDVSLQQLVDLTERGWYSGELHIHRPPDDVPLLMRASDLHIGPVITWWNERNLWNERELPNQRLINFDGNRFTHVVAGEDEREGGALLYFGLDEPIDITGSNREYPSPMEFVKAARKRNPDVHIDIEKPFWWDVPLWLAMAEPDTIGLANNHMCRDRMYETEAWGKPRDDDRLPPPRGNGYWTQEIYYHILNAGFRLPPSAGSASGVLPNAVGYNRVYVQIQGDLTWDKWWEGLRAGRSFVTNGPVLLASASMTPKRGVGLPVQWPPGTVFQSENSAGIVISITVELWTTDDVPRLELIHNGKILDNVDCPEGQQFAQTFSLETEESGWFLVRAIIDNPRTFRFASSAPFYVEAGQQPRISRESCRFFLDWTRERRARVSDKATEPDQREAVLEYHDEAEQFWANRLQQANAD